MTRRDDLRQVVEKVAARSYRSSCGANVAALGLERAVDFEMIFESYLDLLQSRGFRLASWNSYPEIKAHIVAARVSLLAATHAIQAVVDDREDRS